MIRTNQIYRLFSFFCRNNKLTTLQGARLSYARYIVLHDYCYYNGHRGMTEPTSQDLNSFGKDSFFEKYNQFFEMSSVTELYPPTLIFKSKEHL